MDSVSGLCNVRGLLVRDVLVGVGCGCGGPHRVRATYEDMCMLLE